MRVVLLSLTQSYEEVLAVEGHELGCVHDHRHVHLRQLLWDLCCEAVWLWLLYLFEDSLQELCLLRILHGLGLQLGRGFLLFGGLLDFLIILSDELAAVLGHHVIVVGTIGVLAFEEGKLRFVLLDFNKCLLEFGAILGHVGSRLLHHLLDFPRGNNDPDHLL